MRPCQPVFFESAEHSGSATLSEVSYSGARLEVESPGPPVGASIRVYVWPPNHAEPFELAGHVVGTREDGFAIEYEEPGQAICQWIDTLRSAEGAESPTPDARRTAMG